MLVSISYGQAACLLTIGIGSEEAKARMSTLFLVLVGDAVILVDFGLVDFQRFGWVGDVVLPVSGVDISSYASLLW